MGVALDYCDKRQDGRKAVPESADGANTNCYLEKRLVPAILPIASVASQTYK
jgi:hypothetical protein